MADMPLPDMVNSDFLVLLDPMSYPESMENLEALEEFLKSCGTVTTEIHGDGSADPCGGLAPSSSWHGVGDSRHAGLVPANSSVDNVGTCGLHLAGKGGDQLNTA